MPVPVSVIVFPSLETTERYCSTTFPSFLIVTCRVRESIRRMAPVEYTARRESRQGPCRDDLERCGPGSVKCHRTDIHGVLAGAVGGPTADSKLRAIAQQIRPAVFSELRRWSSPQSSRPATNDSYSNKCCRGSTPNPSATNERVGTETGPQGIRYRNAPRRPTGLSASNDLRGGRDSASWGGHRRASRGARSRRQLFRPTGITMSGTSCDTWSGFGDHDTSRPCGASDRRLRPRECHRSPGDRFRGPLQGL